MFIQSICLVASINDLSLGFMATMLRSWGFWRNMGSAGGWVDGSLGNSPKIWGLLGGVASGGGEHKSTGNAGER